MKYRLTEQSQTIFFGGKDVTLYRIELLKDLPRDGNTIKAGTFGGWIEKEDNLSQEGLCWCHEGGRIFGNARVFDDAQVWYKGRVFSNAIVGGDAEIPYKACVGGHAKIFHKNEVHEEDWIV